MNGPNSIAKRAADAGPPLPGIAGAGLAGVGGAATAGGSTIIVAPATSGWMAAGASRGGEGVSGASVTGGTSGVAARGDAASPGAVGGASRRWRRSSFGRGAPPNQPSRQPARAPSAPTSRTTSSASQRRLGNQLPRSN